MTIPENAKPIWDWLSRFSPFTPAGIAALMGNLYAESSLEPNRKQGDFSPLRVKSRDYTEQVEAGVITPAEFASDGVGYGLAQWTFRARKSALLRFARANGTGIDCLQTQLEFLLEELSGDYRAVGDLLRSTEDLAAATAKVLAMYENPADQSARVQELRTGYAREFFRAFADNEAKDEIESKPETDDFSEPVADGLDEYLRTMLPGPDTPITRSDVRRFIRWFMEGYRI